MEAIRETHEVKDGAVTVLVPAGFAAGRVEVIVFPAGEEGHGDRSRVRRPARALAATVIRDDLIEPVVNPEDWDALK